MSDSQAHRKTVLYDLHVSLGAKMTPFGGYLMPLQYEGILKEHTAVRERVGLFDTCHMGEFLLRGPNVVADLEKLLTCPISSMEVGSCRYGFLCSDDGGVIDDQVLYRLDRTEFMMVVNAGTRDNDLSWITQHLGVGSVIEDISDATAKLDLQGPSSPRIMSTIAEESIEGMRFYRWMHNGYRGRRIVVSRTGYTGEIGFEIYCDTSIAPQLWNDCLDLGAVPAGLGARDTLRLEMGMPLYGHELDEARNPAESGFSRSIATDKMFIGSRRVLDPTGRTHQLVGIELDGRRAARAGDRVKDENGAFIGTVTSGSYSPSLGKGIALAYVERTCSQAGRRVEVSNGKQELTGSVVELPFYRSATGRRPISDFLHRNT